MADAYLLAPEPYEQVQILLPRGVVITSAERHGGAIRYQIRGKDLTEGMGYQLVSTDGYLLRCIELVENPVPEDPKSKAEPQPVRKPEPTAAAPSA